MSLLATLAPIFGLIALGFLAAKAGGIDGPGVRGLVLFVFNFAIPSLLLRGIAELAVPDDVPWLFLAAFYGGTLVTYGIGMLVARLGFGRPLADQAIYAMCGSYSNLVLMGIPIVLTALGPEASLPMLLVIAFHSAIFLPITVALVQRGKAGRGRGRWGVLVAETARNPIIVGIALGFVLNLSGITLWSGLDRLLELLATAAVPCALFALGASLAGYSLHGQIVPAAALATLKLAVHPLVVWLAAGPVLGLDGLWVTVPVALAAMPSGVNTYLFAARYGVSAEVAARTVLLTSVCSMVTISIVLGLLVT